MEFFDKKKRQKSHDTVPLFALYNPCFNAVFHSKRTKVGKRYCREFFVQFVFVCVILHFRLNLNSFAKRNSLKPKIHCSHIICIYK